MYTNIRHISANWEEFKQAIHFYDPDVVGITETWLDSDISDAEYSLPGYLMFRKDRVNKQGGGVLVYAKSYLQPHTNIKLSAYEESVAITLHPDNSSKMQVGCLYRSPNSSNEANAAVVSLLRSIHANDSVVFMGDFNCPHVDWLTYTGGPNCLPVERDIASAIQDSFLHQVVTQPTRITADCKSILDLVLVPLPDLIQNLEHHTPIGTSDHNTLTWTALSAGVVGPSRQPVGRKNYRKANFGLIRDEL